MTPFEAQTYYELLEVPVTASDEEIRAAHGRAMETYAPDSIAVYALEDPSQLEALRARLTEAMEILTEPDLRRDYDRILGMSGTAAPASPAPAEPAAEPAVTPPPPEAPPPAPEPARPTPAPVPPMVSRPNQPPPKPKPMDVPSDAEFNGELLRRVRESRNMTIRGVADRTRISARHLENVEADRYGTLPPAVYLRGILTSYARELGLDPARVARSYLLLASQNSSR